MTRVAEPLWLVEFYEAIGHGESWTEAYCSSPEDAEHFISHYMEEWYRVERDDEFDCWRVYDDDTEHNGEYARQVGSLFLREIQMYRQP